MKYKTYIIKAAQDALLEPIVVPEETSLPDDVVREINFHKDKALYVEDFEGFMELAEKVTEEAGLSPVKDLEKVATVLNLIRKESGLPPL